MRLLSRVLEERLDFAFETTLVGSTITQLLSRAALQGIEIRSRGGHDFPECDSRHRYEHSRLNLIALLPQLTALRVHDNSREADPAAGEVPLPRLVLRMERGEIIGPADLSHTPDWAKPIVAAALKLRRP